MLRRTKIVCTMGPALDKEGVLEELIKAGANVVRINFSHGSAEEHMARAQKVREISQRLGVYTAIVGDLQGPKIRISTFKEGRIFLNTGDLFTLDASMEKGEGTKDAVGIDYKDLPKDVKTGDTAKVVKVCGEGAVKRRIMDMGITRGVEIFVRKLAPLGDPVEVNVRDYELSLRKADAEMIEVE